MTPDEARLLFTDYLEDALDHQTRDRLQAFLAETPESAAELISFERTLTLMHRLPPREPVLDMWPALTEELAAYRAARTLSVWQRLHQNWQRLRSDLSAGIILWTHAVAARAHARLERYLLHDSLTPYQRHPGRLGQ